MDHQKKKAKVIKIEKEENGDNKKQHLTQKIFNEDCKMEKLELAQKIQMKNFKQIPNKYFQMLIILIFIQYLKK